MKMGNVLALRQRLTANVNGNETFLIVRNLIWGWLNKILLVFVQNIPTFKGSKYECEVFNMKKTYFAVALSLILVATVSVPALGSNSLMFNLGGGGTRGDIGHSSIGGNLSGGEIPLSLAHHILELAAPQFGLSSGFLIRKYHSGCGCVLITQTGPNTYSVTYGGVTIQILIESGSNNDSGLSQLSLGRE